MPKSKLILFACQFFIIGVALSSFLAFYHFLFLILLLITVVWFWKKSNFFKKNKALIISVLFFLILGFIRNEANFYPINQQHISFYQNQKIVFQGKVISEPDLRNNKINLTLGKLTINQEKIKGKILLEAPVYSEYHYHDLLQVNCFLKKPFQTQSFDYQAYLAQKNVYAICNWSSIELIEKNYKRGFYYQILAFKSKSRNLLVSFFPEPQNAFLAALLLGDKKQVSENLRNWFAFSGISHLLAISGLHLVIFSQLIRLLFIRVFLIPRQKAFYFILLFIVFYIVLTGASSSAVRAGIMVLLFLLSQNFSRPQNTERIIFYTAGLMLFINPKILASDLSFQFSFSAILGINYFFPFFQKLFKKVPLGKDYLALSLSAQIGVLPLVLYRFGNFSLIAPLMNILIIPYLPIVMVLGFCFIIFGLISLFLAKAIFYPLWILTTAIILLAKLVAKIPYLSFLIVDFSKQGVLVLYLLIFFLFLNLKKNVIKEN